MSVAILVAACGLTTAGRAWTVAAQAPSRAPAVESPCAIETPERVIAVGDVHGAYDRFVAILRAAGVIDRRDRWAGGRTRLVQTGDVLDRGPDSRKVIDLLRRLERDAASAGGRVHALLGNHEFMRIAGDWRYVSTGEFKAFQNAESVDLRERAHTVFANQAEARARSERRGFDPKEYREQFMKDVPLGFLEMRLAFDKGEYGRWVRTRVPVVRINRVLFLHGGISARVAELGCDGINAAIAKDVAAVPVPPEQVLSLLASTEDGPLWYRGLAQEPEASFAPALDAILKRLDAAAIVVGHTPVPKGRMLTRFGGRVVQIDTGMLNGEFYPGGVPSALEIRGRTLTAIYEDRREALGTIP